MTRSRNARWAKGTLVSAVAAVVCYWTWELLRTWAQDIAAAHEWAMGAGWYQAMLAGVTGVLAMPLLLWAGMRLLGERGNHLLVAAGVVAWWFIGGQIVEDGVGRTATVVFLALFALLGGALSRSEVAAT
jgi:hypothetical protein